MARNGGRPGLITSAAIIEVGRELGLTRLTMNAVAERLGVSSTALYRHVEDRWGLECLIGESLLADIDLVDHPEHGVAEHLTSVGLQLRRALLDNPGLAAYVQTLFPRGQSGRGLLTTEVEALGRRGYTPDVAMVLASAVASIAIGYAAAEDIQQQRADEREVYERRLEAELRADSVLGAAYRGLPELGNEEYVRLWIGAAVHSFVELAPPGRPIDEVWSALAAAGKGI
jgi:AcrR family transcriptional regulator